MHQSCREIWRQASGHALERFGRCEQRQDDDVTSRGTRRTFVQRCQQPRDTGRTKTECTSLRGRFLDETVHGERPAQSARAILRLSGRREHTAARANLHQHCIRERGQNTFSRGAGDVQLTRQLANGRESFARVQPPSHHLCRNLPFDLRRVRHTALTIYL
jgi:hypothetical protein